MDFSMELKFLICLITLNLLTITRTNAFVQNMSLLLHEIDKTVNYFNCGNAEVISFKHGSNKKN